MKGLLDTHVFLWWNLDDPQLSPRARAFISDGSNELYFSAASAWEIVIKVLKGRLVLPEPPARYVGSRLADNRILPLPVQLSHALGVADLPGLHHDPFDRLLIAQCQMEDMPIVTADAEIARYQVNVIW